MAQRQMAEDLTSSRVIIGVDPHKASHTAAVLGTRREVLAHLRVPSDRAGYRQLRRWSARWPRRLWAVENTVGLGNSLTQWLLNDGEQVVDVPAKLSARVRLLSSGHGRKTDQADALSTALAACGTAELRPAVVEVHTTTLRLLSDRRDESVPSWLPRSLGGSGMCDASRRPPASPRIAGWPRSKPPAAMSSVIDSHAPVTASSTSPCT